MDIRRKSTKPGNPKPRVQVRLDPETLAKVDETAKDETISREAVIRRAVHRDLKVTKEVQ